MSNWLLTAVAVVYVYVAWSYYQRGSLGLCLAFSAYALSNIGFVIHNRSLQ